MRLEFYNCPAAEPMDSELLPERSERALNPNHVNGLEFLDYQPNFDLIEKYQKEFEGYKNLLIIGHGGSLTTFYGYYSAFSEQSSKNVYFLASTDPDYIFELKRKLKSEETLVIPISKSGETTTQIEALMQFAEYPMLIITGKTSSLRAIGEKLNSAIAVHPPIGGRFTGLTEVALLPAGICGLNVREIYEGAKTFYNVYNKENLAWKAASVLYQLEEDGYVDVFLPFYTHNVFLMSNLIVQLCHESFGKAGRGQTYFAHEAPESQHHTNQRFFGGRKNICGFFTTVDQFNHPTVNVFPPAAHSVQMKGHHLADINKIPLEKSMEFEAQGTMEDARIQGIPLLHLSLASVTAREIGSLVAFWQLYAVYASVLRQVDPFDQPQVENSKNISFNKRLEYKGLL